MKQQQWKDQCVNAALKQALRADILARMIKVLSH